MEGYYGPMCLMCDIKERYYYSISYTCLKCDSKEMVIMY